MGALVHQGRDVVPPEPKPEGAQLRDCLERSDHLATRTNHAPTSPIDRTAMERGVKDNIIGARRVHS